MQYPKELLRNHRDKLDSSDILDSHYLYKRHKPGHDWDENLDLPDFSKIRIEPDNQNENQSFNWEKFSEPHWVRFTPQGEYLLQYAVVGYLTETIRKADIYDQRVEKDLVDVEHDPIEENYSHCQIFCLDKLKQMQKAERKKQKRFIRLAMKHKALVSLKPYHKHI